MAECGKRGFELGPPLATGKIEKSPRADFFVSDGDGQSFGVGRHMDNLGKAQLPRRQSTALAHQIERQAAQMRNVFGVPLKSMRARCNQRIECPSRGRRLCSGNLEQRTDDGFMAERFEAPGRFFCIRLGPREEDAHVSMRQNIGGCTCEQFLPCLHAQPLCIVERAFALRFVKFRAVLAQDEAAEIDAVACDFGMACNRRPAGAVEHAQESSFHGQSKAGGRMQNGTKPHARLMVVAAHGNADCALSDGGQEIVLVENFRHVMRQAEAFQSSQSQKRCIAIAAFQFGKPCLDIAAQKIDAQIGTQFFHHRLAAQRGRADQRARRKCHEAFGARRDEDIAHILAREEAGNIQPIRQNGRQIFGRMDRNIDFAGELGEIDFLGEQTFAAGLGKSAVENLVTHHLDDDDFDSLSVNAMCLCQKAPGLVSLSQGQRAPACANFQPGPCPHHALDICIVFGADYRVSRRGAKGRPFSSQGQNRPPMRVLGIETTCDETAAAVVSLSPGGHGDILSNEVMSQIAEHAAYGGVVPEIAARAHLDVLDRLVGRALADAGLRLDQIDGVAAAAGPGLIGGVIVGLTFGKALALAAGKPFIGVNHLEAHALTARLTDGVDFPYLLLLVSGGHTQLLSVRGVGDYRRIGTTIDDAIGEAFDKVAKMLGLPYPGGPQVEKQALNGDPQRFEFPRPMLRRPGADFSFSGLKTAVRLEVERIAPLRPHDVADVCASFQAAVVDVVIDRIRGALRIFRQQDGDPRALVVAGGVAANGAIRRALGRFAGESGLNLIMPSPALCTDNGAMIAWAGIERLRRGMIDGMDFPARPRWPLDPQAERVNNGKA